MPSSSPKSQWLLLTAVALLTTVALAGSAELIARLVYTESTTTTLSCLVINDANTGVRGIPNSRCRQKMFESGTVSYNFNSCGHRAGMECGPKPPGTYRIVVVGSSVAYGMWAEREHTFAALLPAELSQRTGRKVEVYNEAMQWGVPRSVELRFSEVLAEQPDVILWALTPFDVYNVDFLLPYAPAAAGADPSDPALPRTPWQRLVTALTKKSPSQFVQDAWKRGISAFGDSRALFLLRNLLYRSQSQYINHYLMDPQDSAFLRANPSPEWLQNVVRLSHYTADLQARAAGAGAKLVLVLVPQRAQAAMLSLNHWPPGFDPYRIGEQVNAVAADNGATYVDILHGFRDIPNPEQYYYPVDGHLDEHGHAVVARLLGDALTRGKTPAIAAASVTAPAQVTAVSGSPQRQP